MENFLGNAPLETAHALFRVSGAMKHKELKLRLEFLGIQFLEQASSGEFAGAVKSLDTLISLVSLAEAVGEIPYAFSQALYRQFDSVKSAIKQQDEEKMKFANPEAVLEQKPAIGSYKHSIADAKTERRQAFYQPPSQNTKERQNMISELIRQSGNIAMKDLIAAFPQVSERTLRYDLEKLCDQLIIERIGNGGPASFYRLRGVLPVAGEA